MFEEHVHCRNKAPRHISKHLADERVITLTLHRLSNSVLGSILLSILALAHGARLGKENKVLGASLRGGMVQAQNRLRVKARNVPRRDIEVGNFLVRV
jgi:hypothetical protein